MDDGLLLGLAQGVQGAFQGYRDASSFAMDQAMKKKRMEIEDQQLQMQKENNQMSRFAQGVQLGDQGQMEYTPEMKTQKALQAATAQEGLAEKGYEMDATGQVHPTELGTLKQQSLLGSARQSADSSNPESKTSAQYRTVTRGVLKASGLDPSMITDDMSASDIEKMSEKGLLGKTVTGVYGERGRQAMADAMMKRAELSNQNRVVSNQSSANRQYSTEMKPFENTMQQADRSMEIANKISAGELKSTSQLRSDLSSALASMMNNGKPATVFGMSHQDFDSLWGRMQKAYGMVSGTTPDTMTNAQLNQLKLDIGALRNEYAKQHEIAYKSFREGLHPSVVNPLDNRYKTFRKSKGLNTDLEDQGAIANEPTSMLPAKQAAAPGPQAAPSPPHPQDNQAIQWAKQNMNDPRAQAILKANGM